MRPEVERLLRRLNAAKYEDLAPEEAEAAQELVASGLAELPKKPKSGEHKLRLTRAGKERQSEILKAEKEALKAAQPAKPPRTRATTKSAAPSSALSLDNLNEALAALEERLFNRLIIALRPSATTTLSAASITTPATPPSNGNASLPLDDRIVDTLRRLNALHRFDGLVPLPYLRRELADVTRNSLDSALFALEQSQRIALKISNDPAAASDPDQGIRLEGRGLIYYARPR